MISSFTRFIVALSVTACSQGFLISPSKSTTALQVSSLSDLPSSSESMYSSPSSYYIIYPDENANDQEPRLVCTNAPEEYAWFHGIKLHDMIPLKEGASVSAMECQESESFRGVPEWECSLGMTNLRP